MDVGKFSIFFSCISRVGFRNWRLWVQFFTICLSYYSPLDMWFYKAFLKNVGAIVNTAPTLTPRLLVFQYIFTFCHDQLRYNSQGYQYHSRHQFLLIKSILLNFMQVGCCTFIELNFVFKSPKASLQLSIDRFQTFFFIRKLLEFSVDVTMWNFYRFTKNDELKKPVLEINGS